MEKSADVAGFYKSIQGGFNELLYLELEKDGSYELIHMFIGDVIGADGRFLNSSGGRDSGTWSFENGVLALNAKEIGTDRSSMFLPAYCDRFKVGTYSGSVQLTSIATPAIPVASPQKIVLNKSAGPPWTKPPPREARYPAHWWAAVSAEGAPAWEILPQAAGPGEVILSKRHELGLLSNFASTPFTFRGVRYASLEGFWQMMKYPEDDDDPRAKFPGLKWEFTRAQVAQLTAFEAKRAGDLASDNMKKMGISWVSFEGRRFDYRPAEPGEHYGLIVAATEEKVHQNPEVRKVLLATGDLKLLPDHHQEPDAPAAWRYFEILTAIRTRLKQSP